MMKYFLSMLIWFLVVACTTSPVTTQNSQLQAETPIGETAEKLLIGSWYGKYASDFGDIIEFISVRSSDGTYIVKFRSIDSEGLITQQNEKGIWRVEGNRYITNTKAIAKPEEFAPVDAMDPFYNDEYDIILLNDNTFQYQHVLYKVAFTAKRVSNNYSFPKVK
ncbi:MAG: hypothetical protein AAF603_06560 [Pseudomonadota bacterium]